MHKDEIWQTYYPNGESIIGEGWDAFLNEPEETGSNVIVGIAIVFLYRHTENGLEFLWQKRSDKIDRYPGDYDFSAGGHINLGESAVEAAIRETHEEIGVEVSAEDLHFVTMRPFSKDRFAWVYLVDFTGKEENFHFDDEEVSEVKWVPLDKLDEFRLECAKAPLKKDNITFECIKQWSSQYGDL
ncbi:NUDIX domain-containing protein [Candidatus Saccharibacteria bacterium]|nr:NUDIX domain-containing protein [Candidatus Saccharibacteria bacterium]